jgi:hypothetical protein
LSCDFVTEFSNNLFSLDAQSYIPCLPHVSSPSPRLPSLRLASRQPKSTDAIDDAIGDDAADKAAATASKEGGSTKKVGRINFVFTLSVAGYPDIRGYAAKSVLDALLYKTKFDCTN